VPADKKWFTRLVVAAAIIDALEELNLHYPKVDKVKRRELEVARALLLENEKKDGTKGKKNKTKDEEDGGKEDAEVEETVEGAEPDESEDEEDLKEEEEDEEE
jgi:hypothetical protein